MIYNMAGGKKLPELTNPATAADLLEGKQLIDADGNVITGTIPSLGKMTITPDRYDKYVDPGQYLSGGLTVEGGGSDFRAYNIVKGNTIFGVEGTALDYSRLDDLTRSNIVQDKDCSITNYQFSNNLLLFTLTITIPFSGFSFIMLQSLDFTINGDTDVRIMIDAPRGGQPIETGYINEYSRSTGEGYFTSVMFSDYNMLYNTIFPTNGNKGHINMENNKLVLTVDGLIVSAAPSTASNHTVNINRLCGYFY